MSDDSFFSRCLQYLWASFSSEKAPLIMLCMVAVSEPRSCGEDALAPPVLKVWSFIPSCCCWSSFHDRSCWKTFLKVDNGRFPTMVPVVVVNPSCTSRIFQSIPVQPPETTVSIFKVAFLATQDFSSESLCRKKTSFHSKTSLTILKNFLQCATLFQKSCNNFFPQNCLT